MPPDFTPAQKRIISVYLEVTADKRLVGSALYREVAQRLFYTIDENRSHSFVRRVIQRFTQQTTRV